MAELKLSMWIIKDVLKKYGPEARIHDGQMTITGLRVFSRGSHLEDYAVYIGTCADFFPNDTRKNIVCRNRNDYLILDTEDLADVINAVQDTYSKTGRWNDKCLAAAEKGNDLQDLLDAAKSLFGSPMMIVDAAQVVVARSSDMSDVTTLEDWENLASNRSLTLDRLKAFNKAYADSFFNWDVFTVPAGAFPTKSYCKHIRFNGDRIGTIILKTLDHDHSKGVIQMFDYFASVYLVKWMENNLIHDKPFQLASFFTRFLEGDESVFPIFERQLNLFGWEANCRKQIFVIAIPDGDEDINIHLSRVLSARNLGIYALAYQKQLVVLCNIDSLDHASLVKTIHSVFKENRYYGAASFLFTELCQLQSIYQQTLSILHSSPAEPGELYLCQNSSMKIISDLVENSNSQIVMHPAPDVLAHYDSEHGTEYYNTLFSFLRNESRHAQTAAELFIHRNTLQQRLDRIGALYPINLDNPDERFFLLFSFYQRQYVNKSEGSK